MKRVLIDGRYHVVKDDDIEKIVVCELCKSIIEENGKAREYTGYCPTIDFKPNGSGSGNQSELIVCRRCYNYFIHLVEHPEKFPLILAIDSAAIIW